MHRRAVVAIAALFALVGGSIAQVSAAQPPSPGSEEVQSNNDVERAAARVETLADKVTEAKDALTAAQLELAAAYDKVSAAQREARAAKSTAESARELADTTRREAEAAKARLRKARNAVDRLAAASLRLGNIDSARAYLGADSVDDALARASLLDAISASHSETLADLRRASAKKADKKAAARAALQQAVDKREQAERAVGAAKQAYEKAHSRAGCRAARRGPHRAHGQPAGPARASTSGVGEASGAGAAGVRFDRCGRFVCCVRFG